MAEPKKSKRKTFAELAAEADYAPTRALQEAAGRHIESVRGSSGNTLLQSCTDFPGSQGHHGCTSCSGYRTHRRGEAARPDRQWIDAGIGKRGWQEKHWDTKIVVDTVERASPTHLVDCYKNKIALEFEWSNKDPFYDRDLNNFRLLFDLRVISVGVIVTKSNELAPLFNELGLGEKYGASTTWMSKLLPRVLGGGGGGCPLLVFGIRRGAYLKGK